MAAHPAARVRTLAELHAAIAGCRMCPRVNPPPILWAREGQRALIIGQAPGITEPQRGLPFAGAAGGSSSPGWPRWASPITSPCSNGSRSPPSRSATRGVCRAAAATERPTATSASAAGPGRMRSCGCATPRSSCPSDGLAIDDWLGPAPLAEVVGRSFEREGRVVVPLPHPSGASAWTNDAGNRALVEAPSHSCARRSSDGPPRTRHGRCT